MKPTRLVRRSAKSGPRLLKSHRTEEETAIIKIKRFFHVDSRY